MAEEFLVIGIGRFGGSLVRQLAKHKAAVMAVDIDSERIQELAMEIDAAVCADSTDEAALAELMPARFSTTIVAIGAAATEASILTTALLQKLGAPRIIARATSSLHRRVLAAVGAHEVIDPEAAMGESLARRLVVPNVLKQMDLGAGAELAEITVPKTMVGKSLEKLALRPRFGVTLVAIRRDGMVLLAIKPEELLQERDVLVVIGPAEGIARMVDS